MKDKPKIHFIIGISGSGKTTIESKKYTDVGYIRINRDDLRESLFNLSDSQKISDYYKDSVNLFKKENLISIAMFSLMDGLIKENKDIVLDNTNLKEKYIKEIIERYKDKAIFQYSVVEISLKQAIFNDSQRSRNVGEDVITKQYNNLNILKPKLPEIFNNKPEPTSNIYNNENLPKCFVFDIDGTLALMNNKRSPFEWNKVGLDELNLPVKLTLDSLKKDGYKIIICSGRDSICRQETIDWLYVHDIQYDELLMRKEKDNRKDSIIKEEFWKYLTDKYYIVTMFDDRNQVVDHARNLGFSVFQVNYGDF